MANAGRILILPKGTYDASATYEFLDVVSYNNSSWLARQTVTGVEPVEGEYWFKLAGGAELANNLDTEEEGHALDAVQGKVLKELIDACLTGADVVDNLLSSATDLPLSANMGKLLQEHITTSKNIRTQNLLDANGNQLPPNAFLDSALSIGYAHGSVMGLGFAMYVPILTIRGYESSTNVRTVQIATDGTSIKFRYSTSETTWSGWTEFVSTGNLRYKSITTQSEEYKLKPWLSLKYACQNGLMETGKPYVGKITCSEIYGFWGTFENANYASFIVHRYNHSTLYHVICSNGQWSYTTIKAENQTAF